MRGETLLTRWAPPTHGRTKALISIRPIKRKQDGDPGGHCKKTSKEDRVLLHGRKIAPWRAWASPAAGAAGPSIPTAMVEAFNVMQDCITRPAVWRASAGLISTTPPRRSSSAPGLALGQRAHDVALRQDVGETPCAAIAPFARSTIGENTIGDPFLKPNRFLSMDRSARFVPDEITKWPAFIPPRWPGNPAPLTII